MKVLEIRDDSLLVTTNMGNTAIARYEDKDGIFFYNENLDKEYVTDLNMHKEEPERKKEYKQEEQKPKKNTYKFAVVTSNKWGEPSRHYDKEFKAYSLDEACEKIENNYKHIFDYEITDMWDSEGNIVHIKNAY